MNLAHNNKAEKDTVEELINAVEEENNKVAVVAAVVVNKK